MKVVQLVDNHFSCGYSTICLITTYPVDKLMLLSNKCIKIFPTNSTIHSLNNLVKGCMNSQLK